MSVPVEKLPIVVSRISGPQQAVLGERATYTIKEYNRSDVTADDKLSIKWIVSLFKNNKETKVYRTLPLDIFQVSADTLVIRKVPQDWRYHEIHVYAFVDKPTTHVRVKTKILGAWIVNKKWNAQDIQDYKKSVKGFSGFHLKTKGEKFVCEDFVLTSIMNFAMQRGLPLKIENGTGKYDAKRYNYNNGATMYESFEHRVLLTTGAHDLMQFRTNTSVIKKGNIVIKGKADEITIRKISAGDLFLLEFDTDGLANHIQLVTDIVPVPSVPGKGKPPKLPLPIIKIAQGNFPSDSETTWRYTQRFLLQGNPNDPEASNYYGVEVQKAEYDFNALKYTRNGSTSNKPPKQIFFVARWNFYGW